MKMHFIILAVFALLTSCNATAFPLDNGLPQKLDAPSAVAEEGDEGSPFTLSDTVSYQSPYGDYTVNEINQAIIDSIKADAEAKAKQKEEDDAAFKQDLTRAFTAAIGIGSALYSKDYSNISENLGNLGGSVMKMLGYESGQSYLNWNYRIFDAIQELAKKLDAISSQITEMEESISNHINYLSNSIQSTSNRILNAIVDAETKTRYSQSITLFQAAKANWDSFVSRAYVPMENKINNFTNHYTEYFGNFLDQCYIDHGATLNLYYNAKGGITLPRNGTDYDLFGERITHQKTVHVPLAAQTFARYNAHNGHAYRFMDLEILQDFIDSGVPNNLAEDCIMNLRLLASQSYFSSSANVGDYFDTYLTFTNYMSGQSMGGVDSTNMKPIDVYNALLSSVYNYGFETEEEMTAVVSKLGRTLYSASTICDMASVFARTDTYDAPIKSATEAALKELTLENRIHPSKGRKIYCLDLDTYAEFQDHELLLQGLYEAKNTEKRDGVTTEDAEKPEYELVENSAKVFLDRRELNLASLQENSLTLADFLMMKIKYATYSPTLFAEAPSFGTYLVGNGVINDPRKTVVFSLGEILYDEVEPGSDPTFDFYAIGNRRSDDYEGDPFVPYAKISDDAKINEIAKLAVTGQAATFDSQLHSFSNYILGTGFVHKEDDGKTCLDLYAAHADYVPENGDYSSFVHLGGYKDNKIHNENGYSLSFYAYDLADVYLLMKVSVE